MGASVDPVRLQYLAAHLYSLGPRPTFEFIREITTGADPMISRLEVYARLEAYARLDPDTVDALGGRDFPPRMFLIDGGRA